MTILLLLFLFISSSSAARLQLIPANEPEPWVDKIALSTGDKICPTDYFPAFSVECVVENAQWVNFYVNGVFIYRDVQMPFILSGDINGIARQWTAPKHSEIVCQASNGEIATVSVTFECGRTTIDYIQLEKYEETPSQVPYETGESLEENWAQTNSDSHGYFHESNYVQPSMTPGLAEDYCVNLNATDYIYNKGWEQNNGAMSYKLDGEWDTDDRQGASYLVFRFTAPVQSRYAITVDMSTTRSSNHNSIWGVIHGQPLALEKMHTAEVHMHWVEMYHNVSGRHPLTFSVDSSGVGGQSVSTAYPLQQGWDYVVALSGKSSGITVYRVLLIPCQFEICLLDDVWDTAIC